MEAWLAARPETMTNLGKKNVELSGLYHEQLPVFCILSGPQKRN
jgi:hypothetical protein